MPKKQGQGQYGKNKSFKCLFNQVYTKLLQCHKELLEEDKIISSDAIKYRYLGEDENSKTPKDLIAYHNSNMIHVLKAGAMKNYYTTYTTEKYLHKFL